MPGDAPQLTFFEHLEEFRRRLLTCLVAVGALALAGYCVSEQALAVLTAPLRAQGGSAYFFSPQGAFTARLKVALFLGLVGAAPVILHQLWRFLAPALLPNERRAAAPFVAVTTTLFLAGVAFAHFVVTPAAMDFLLGLGTADLRPMISVEEYLSFLMCMALAFGAAFNLPVLVVGLVLGGVVDAAGLNRFQRQAVLLIFIAAAVLTPGPDVASQLLLAVPLLVLFEASVGAALLIGAARRRKALRAREGRA